MLYFGQDCGLVFGDDTWLQDVHPCFPEEECGCDTSIHPYDDYESSLSCRGCGNDNDRVCTDNPHDQFGNKNCSCNTDTWPGGPIGR